jgi:hypothetical protein
MNLLSDILTYMRRILKLPSDASITDNLLVDYVNRFGIEICMRIELFDLKTTYQFLTQPGVDQYNMPLFSIQPSPIITTPPALQAPIASFPVYQGFTGPCTINGIHVPFQTQRELFNSQWTNFVPQGLVIGTGNGTAGPYTLQLPFLSPNAPNVPEIVSSCIVRGHVDIAGIISAINAGQPNVDPIITPTFLYNTVTSQCVVPTTSTFPAVYFSSIDATGANVVIADSGQFLTGAVNYGLLMSPGAAPFGNQPLSGNTYSTTQNTFNYLTGIAQNVTFPTAIPAGQNITATVYFYQTGLPRAIMFFNNTLTLRTVPDTQYLVELIAYRTPTAFLNSADAIPYGYMCEYIARGAVRKILADTGDIEQFNFYEQLFKEQESLVWKRSQRQFTSTRTETIYSTRGGGFGQGNGLNNN